jgi:hypothetical protein
MICERLEADLQEDISGLTRFSPSNLLVLNF